MQSAAVITDGRRARGEATSARILEAASELFAAQGYAATPISQIAQAAGVQSASLYHAFGSKEGVLAAVVERASEEFFAGLEVTETLEELWATVEGLADSFSESPLFLRLLLVLVLERRDGDPAPLEKAAAVRERGRDLLRRSIAGNLPDLPAARVEQVLDEMGRVLIMLLDGAFIARQVDAGPDEMERVFRLITLALRGLLEQLLAEAAR